MTNQLISYDVIGPDAEHTTVQAEARIIRDGALVFMLGRQPAVVLAHTEWRSCRAAPVPTFPGKPTNTKQPRLLPAVEIPG